MCNNTAHPGLLEDTFDEVGEPTATLLLPRIILFCPRREKKRKTFIINLNVNEKNILDFDSFLSFFLFCVLHKRKKIFKSSLEINKEKVNKALPRAHLVMHGKGGNQLDYPKYSTWCMD